jgi:hypothetical protein
MLAESVPITHGRHCMVESREVHVIATVSEREFHVFSLYVAELQGWPSYHDFTMERDGYLLGLSWAGENVVQVEVPLGSFARWVELTGSPRNLESLDDFAMRRWLRSQYPERSVRLVRATATSPAGSRNEFLDIPFCLAAAAAQETGVLPGQPEENSDADLAGVIARECLDIAD